VVLRYFQKQISVGSKFELNLFLVNAKLSKIKQYDEEAYKLFKVTSCVGFWLKPFLIFCVVDIPQRYVERS
jgi:hypothetical protein